MDWHLEVKIWAEDNLCSSCPLIQETKISKILNILTSLYHVERNTCTVHGTGIRTRCFGLILILRLKRDWSQSVIDKDNLITRKRCLLLKVTRPVLKRSMWIIFTKNSVLQIDQGNLISRVTWSVFKHVRLKTRMSELSKLTLDQGNLINSTSQYKKTLKYIMRSRCATPTSKFQDNQRPHYVTIGQRNWVRKLLDNQKGKLLDNQEKLLDNQKGEVARQAEGEVARQADFSNQPNQFKSNSWQIGATS